MFYNNRVSSEEQARHDLSIPYQKDQCIKIAEERGYHVIEEFSDAGISGENAQNRPALKEMLKYIVSHGVKAVVVHKFDRLSRSNKDFWNIVNYLREKDIALVSVAENFDMNTPSGL
ncbi:MAG: recombinase family protein [Candidatus Dojkabacteria bacterium]